MNYAIVDGKRTQPKPKMKGTCPMCGSILISKCGNIKIWHWAHLSKNQCDHWWESESTWHREWKNEFPIEQQEVIHKNDLGEKHIADVKTDLGLVIELQNSSISEKELLSRNEFYIDICWLINGNNLGTKSHMKFINTLSQGSRINEAPLTYEVQISKNKLIEKWSKFKKPIFIDFQEEDLDRGKTLWLIWPIDLTGKVFISRFYFDELKAYLGYQVSDITLLAKTILKDLVNSKKYNPIRSLSAH